MCVFKLTLTQIVQLVLQSNSDSRTLLQTKSRTILLRYNNYTAHQIYWVAYRLSSIWYQSATVLFARLNFVFGNTKPKTANFKNTRITSCISKFESFSQELSSAIETFFPWKTVKTYLYDKPWITVKLKSMIKKRQAAFINYGKHSLVFRMWRNRVQGAIKTAKRSYYDSKVEGLAETNPKKWWQDIKSLTGQDFFSKQEWHHQLLNVTINSPVLLAAQINDFFTSITHEFEPLTQVQTPPNVISWDLLVSLEEVTSDLLKLPTQKAVGPDGISNKLLKEFVPEQAPLIQDIYNQSLWEGFVPDTLKQSIITSVLKVFPPSRY